MSAVNSYQLSYGLGLCANDKQKMLVKFIMLKGRTHLQSLKLSSRYSWQDYHGFGLSYSIPKPVQLVTGKRSFKCHSSLGSGQYNLPSLEITSSAFTRICGALLDNPTPLKIISAVGAIVFTLWGFEPVVRHFRHLFFRKSDRTWKKSGTYYVTTTYLQPLLLWAGATLIFRALDLIVMPSEAGQAIKLRLLTFLRSLSTMLAVTFCLTSMIQQAQKFFTETIEASDATNMGFQFVGQVVYSAIWVASISLFMELLGFSTKKWLTAGGLGTVLLTLSAREIFTNFLSSAMIHVTRPFAVNERIQVRIESYDVSGTVEHVGWWSPTIIRGDDREAVHIPTHKLTVNVVRNLSQKSHWRIKTHLAISHLDVNKINKIVAHMRKVLAKNPQVEQRRLHRRVFLEDVNAENQALMILISCFVKTSHFEEYLSVKEAILFDLMRVISHHGARLATPIRTIQKVHTDAYMDSGARNNKDSGRGASTSPSKPWENKTVFGEASRALEMEDRRGLYVPQCQAQANMLIDIVFFGRFVHREYICLKGLSVAHH